MNPRMLLACTCVLAWSGAVNAADMAQSRPLVGMYSYMADAASLTLCDTEERYPVALEAAHIDIERAYLAVVEEPGAEVLVFIEARVEERPVIEGPSIHIIPDRLVSLSHEQDCTSLVSMTEETEEVMEGAHDRRDHRGVLEQSQEKWEPVFRPGLRRVYLKPRKSMPST